MTTSTVLDGPADSIRGGIEVGYDTKFFLTFASLSVPYKALGTQYYTTLTLL